MAAVMTIGQVRVLMAEAAAQGCSLAWMQDGSLFTGSGLGRPRYRIDFARERLAPAGVEQAGAEDPLDDRRVKPTRAVPDTQAPTFKLDGVADPVGRMTGNFSLILEGTVIPARSQRALLLIGLQEMERMRPGTLDQLAAEKGRTKRVVARRREQLYEDPKLSRFAEQIENGWWVATNNNYWEMQKFLRRAALHAGLHVEIRRSP